MPPKPTKVQPAPKSATAEKRGKSGGAAKKKITDEPLPPITTISSEKNDSNGHPVHENEIYNEYDLDGHRVQSPEPKTKFGKFIRRVRKAWQKSAAYKKKNELVQKYRDWRYEIARVP